MNRASTSPARPHVCPWWLIRTFDNPLRRLIHRPATILGDLVRPGQACLDLGCGYGYFTMPMARLVGPAGSVTAADVQAEMLAGLRRRAERAGLLSRLRLFRVEAEGLAFAEEFDFALAFWMIHEVPDQEQTLRQLRQALRPAGQLLVVEPLGHVSRTAFAETTALASRLGFSRVGDRRVALSRAALFAVGPR